MQPYSFIYILSMASLVAQRGFPGGSDGKLLGAGTRDPTHDKVMREKTLQARRIRFSGFRKGQLMRSHP